MPDIQVINHGSVVAFIGQTEEGREFLENDVQSEGWQWMGPQLCVDHRYAGVLIEGIQENGLTVGAF